MARIPVLEGTVDDMAGKVDTFVGLPLDGNWLSVLLDHPLTGTSALSGHQRRWELGCGEVKILVDEEPLSFDSGGLGVQLNVGVSSPCWLRRRGSPGGEFPWVDNVDEDDRCLVDVLHQPASLYEERRRILRVPYNRHARLAFKYKYDRSDT